jgi:phospholipase C
VAYGDDNLDEHRAGSSSSPSHPCSEYRHHRRATHHVISNTMQPFSLHGRPENFVPVFLMLALAVGCGGSSGSGTNLPSPSPDTVPQFGHVVLIVEENHSYSEVIGNSAMPYLNSLAAEYSLATQYYANTHPSIGNYFMPTTGQLITNDDAFSGTASVDNIVRELIASGKTWKSYAESIPSTGYTGGDSYPYAKRHNPFPYFAEVVNSSALAQNLVSLSQFNADLANNQLPSFSFVVPNLLDDAHDGSLQVADAWLQQNIAPVISSPTFQKDGLLIIVFDEADTSDSTNGGGHVAAFIISPKAKQGYKSTTLYQHESTLRLILHGLGVDAYPGAASSAPDMGEFF